MRIFRTISTLAPLAVAALASAQQEAPPSPQFSPNTNPVVGYLIGAKAGPALFRRPDSRLFKQAYVDKTQAFFERYGSRAIVLARFVPIVRTFITAVAGVGRMDRRRFFLASAIGAVLWAGLVTIAGYFLGSIDVVRDNIEKVLILIVLISILPMIVEYIRHRRQAAAH